MELKEGVYLQKLVNLHRKLGVDVLEYLDWLLPDPVLVVSVQHIYVLLDEVHGQEDRLQDLFGSLIAGASLAPGASRARILGDFYREGGPLVLILVAIRERYLADLF